jgi:hypothetical protein
MEPQLYYITIATKPHPVLDNIKKRIQQNNEDIHVLGLEENRHIGWQGSANFGIKLREAQDFLFRKEIRPQDIVMLTDAYDVIYCGSQKEIMKRYLSFNKSIVFGCETQCHPDPMLADSYTYRNTEFPFLNSGMYIGEAWALRHCLINYQYNDTDDDQRFWTKQFFNYTWLFGLDYENTLFLNTEGIEWDKLKFQNNKANYKGRTPQFVHVNGPDKSQVNFFL